MCCAVVTESKKEDSMQYQSKFGSWDNGETFVMYTWLSTNEGGRRMLKEAREHRGSVEEKGDVLWQKLDTALNKSSLAKDGNKKPEYEFFYNLLGLTIARVNFEQLIRRA
jgi:hypothetical protein